MKFVKFNIPEGDEPIAAIVAVDGAVWFKSEALTGLFRVKHGMRKPTMPTFKTVAGTLALPKDAVGRKFVRIAGIAFPEFASSQNAFLSGVALPQFLQSGGWSPDAANALASRMIGAAAAAPEVAMTTGPKVAFTTKEAGNDDAATAQLDALADQLDRMVKAQKEAGETLARLTALIEPFFASMSAAADSPTN